MMSIPVKEFEKLPVGESWEDAYRAFLEKQGFWSAEEIEDYVLNAKRIIATIPEPYRKRLIEYFNTFSRDDCICLDCALACLDEIFNNP